MTIATVAIRSEPHTTIGAIIARDATLLVERWCERARAEQPTATRVLSDELRNQLAAFLKAMGRGLHQSGAGAPKEHRHVALEHGEQRWDTGWSLTEVVHDYQLLHLVVLDHLAHQLARPLGYREAMAVSVFIIDAISASVAAYVANSDQRLRDVERAGVENLREEQARKDAFLAVVVHELRNPLTPIVNAAEALSIMTSAGGVPARDTVRVIKRQAAQLARILEDLMDLNGLRGGRLTLHREVVAIADIVEQAVQTSASHVRERKHQLDTQIEETGLRVDGDPARLVQVLTNLLINAAKYTPSGGKITIAAYRVGESVEIAVRDNGQGIPPEMLDQVFDMYTRVSGSAESSPDGLGIGLALVKEFVALHGGAVRASSPGVGHGAEFVVSLPAYEGEETVTRNTPEPIAAIPSLRILVVDDEPDARESLAELLRLRGHEVESAADGARGLERAISGDFDAAFIDFGLPDISGLEVATAIRAARTPLFLIGLSGGAVIDLEKRALEAGFDVYVAKPADGKKLMRVLLSVGKK